MAADADDILEEGSEIKKLMRIIIIAFAVLLVLMGGGFYVLWNKTLPIDPQAEQAENEAAEEAIEPDTIRPVFSLDAFIVNLSDKGGTRYLRTTMDLELTNNDTATEIEQRLPQIRDAILMTIPAKTSKDINTIQGKIALRNEIMEKLNAFIKSGSITNIYFTEFVIQ